MCFDCDKDKVTNPPASAGVVGESKSQQQVVKALDDPNIIHGAVTFKNGVDPIDGYLARLKGTGPYRAVVILHGNAGLPEDIRNTAAQVAQAGFVGLAVSCTSREPDPSQIPRDFLRSNSFGERYMADTQAGIDDLKTQPFLKSGGVGMVGFCGGGIVSLEAAELAELRMIEFLRRHLG